MNLVIEVKRQCEPASSLTFPTDKYMNNYHIITWFPGIYWDAFEKHGTKNTYILMDLNLHVTTQDQFPMHVDSNNKTL